MRIVDCKSDDLIILSQKVEKGMIDFLLQWIPAEKLTVSDIKQIASQARVLTFCQLSEEVD